MSVSFTSHPSSVRYYVLAASEIQFLRWMKAAGLKLQDCNYLGTPNKMRGFSFTSPLRELVVLSGHAEGKDLGYTEEAARLISRYCLDRRVHSVKVVET